jgi:hypothetical protein
MRAIRKTVTNSIISYYNRDGAIDTFTVKGIAIRSIDRAIAVLLRNGISNILVDDIKYERTSYVMDANFFIEHAKVVSTVNDLTADDINNDDDENKE